MSGVSMDEPLMPPPSTSLQKAVSVQPAFLHLADQSALSAMETPSKVYMKRNFLYNELKTVMVSVEQCASLFLLEDFLRNRIKTMDEVKALKIPSGLFQSKPTHGSSHHRIVRHLVERIIDQMRDVMDSTEGLPRSEIKREYARFNEEIISQIVGIKELNEIDHLEIVRALEIHSLQLMDEYFQDHPDEQQIDHLNVGASTEEAPMGNEERIFEFQRSIQHLRELMGRRQREAKKQPEAKEEQRLGGAGELKDQEMKEEGGSSEEKAKLGGAGEDAEMTEEKDGDEDEDMEEEERRLHRDLGR